jgi:hypothetical protein
MAKLAHGAYAGRALSLPFTAFTARSSKGLDNGGQATACRVTDVPSLSRLPKSERTRDSLILADHVTLNGTTYKRPTPGNGISYRLLYKRQADSEQLFESQSPSKDFRASSLRVRSHLPV